MLPFRSHCFFRPQPHGPGSLWHWRCLGLPHQNVGEGWDLQSQEAGTGGPGPSAMAAVQKRWDLQGWEPHCCHLLLTPSSPHRQHLQFQLSVQQVHLDTVVPGEHTSTSVLRVGEEQVQTSGPPGLKRQVGC